VLQDTLNSFFIACIRQVLPRRLNQSASEILIISHGAFYPQLPRIEPLQNGPKTIMSARQPRPAASFATRSKRWASSAARPEPKSSQNAQKNYERYLALARDEAQIGNTVGAENYYQYAEHYFRSMRSDSEGT
jgi:hypothetical protein